MLSVSPTTTAMEGSTSSPRSYRSSFGGSPSRPNSASISVAEVTTFQHARPLDSRSSEPSVRARWYDAWNVVESVAPQPIRSVTRIISGSTASGSR